jgi:hypothetical protein
LFQQRTPFRCASPSVLFRYGISRLFNALAQTNLVFRLPAPIVRGEA